MAGDILYGHDAHISFGGSLYAYGSEWRATHERNVQQEAVFGSGGWDKTWLGSGRMNGSVVVKLDHDMPPEVKAPVSDTQITLTLYEDYQNHPTEFYTVPAKIVSHELGPSARTGAPQEVTINFQSDGAITLPVRS